MTEKDKLKFVAFLVASIIVFGFLAYLVITETSASLLYFLVVIFIAVVIAILITRTENRNLTKLLIQFLESTVWVNLSKLDRVGLKKQRRQQELFRKKNPLFHFLQILMIFSFAIFGIVFFIHGLITFFTG